MTATLLILGAVCILAGVAVIARTVMDPWQGLMGGATMLLGVVFLALGSIRWAGGKRRGG